MDMRIWGWGTVHPSTLSSLVFYYAVLLLVSSTMSSSWLLEHARLSLTSGPLCFVFPLPGPLTHSSFLLIYYLLSETSYIIDAQ